MNRAVIAGLVAIVATCCLSGCGFFVPAETANIRHVIDGSDINLGPVEVRDVVAITTDGKTASLSMTVLNPGPRPVQIRFTYSTAQGPVTQVLDTGPMSILYRGTKPGDPQLLLSGLDAKPGALLSVFVDTGEDVGRRIEVPVLTGALPQYATLLPEPPHTLEEHPTELASPMPASRPRS